MGSDFNFIEQKEQSAIKTMIVTKYFNAWATILSKYSPKIAYIDLFAGPGIYEDGTKSTPVMITETVLNNINFSKKTVLYFNEKNPDYYRNLVNNISNLPGIQNLAHKPIFKNTEIDYDTPQKFMPGKIPAFCFLDPAGYKGLSLELIRSFGKDIGTDIIFFFNYNSINRSITIPAVLQEMIHLFGNKHYHLLLDKLPGQHGQNRESIIINEMAEAIKDIGMQYVLPFRFKFAQKNRTSHYLIFASKNTTAFSIMKDIMFSIGEKDYNGIGQFEFIPSCDRQHFQQLSIIDFYNTPFEDFKQYLCSSYHGRQVTVKQLIDEDISKTKFVKKQYKEALKQLEQEGRITCIPADRKKGTMGDKVNIIFI